MVHETVKTPRARRHDANLERILETAMAMVAEDGIEALSMGRLATAVDYTPGALYRYFDSKDAILAKLVARILEDLGASLAEAVGRLPGQASPLARVFALEAGYRAFARTQPHRFALLASTMAAPRVLLPSPKDAAPVVQLMLATMKLLADALAAAAAGELIDAGDANERAVCVFALLQGVLLLHKQARYAPQILDLDRLATRGTRSLLIGWGAAPRTVDAAVARVAVKGAA